jgi:hypothetical protein
VVDHTGDSVGLTRDDFGLATRLFAVGSAGQGHDAPVGRDVNVAVEVVIDKEP